MHLNFTSYLVEITKLQEKHGEKDRQSSQAQ
jgi:hypothetical protein